MSEESRPTDDDEEYKMIESTHTTRRLYRSRENRMIAGVAGGIAEYFNVDPVLVRIGIVLTVLVTSGAAALAYIAMVIIVPQHPTSDVEPLLDEAPLDSRRNSALIGYGLIAFGLFVLASNLGLLRIFDWGRIWPIALIGVGVLLLLKRGRT